ncbi:UPF0182 family protein [Geitlerinema sp. PCC 7407]|uniref:UPF0182 family protein n=1 Tax=Geitlerinema sp. PCC 7407 TaxID=1173025 RepID=UPI00029FE4FE|nr:UPF0182 family protein [Geitlerinema sp. PCC 7407]AFY65810.1 protein of unknown function UPF0182 [Geitlerinema sp. PCC 7407]
MGSPFWKQTGWFALGAFGLWVLLDVVANLVAESLWFQEVGFLGPFWVQLGVRGAIWLVVLAVSLTFLLGNLAIAHRWQHHSAPEELPLVQGTNWKPMERTPKARWPGALGVRPLLVIVVVLGIALGGLLWHYGYEARTYWHPALGLPGQMMPLPQQLQIQTLWTTWRSGLEPSWPLLSIGAIALLCLIKPRLSLTAGAIALSFALGFVLSGQWARLLQWLYATPFAIDDPIFHRDIAFYVFGLPIGELLQYWAVALSLYSFLSVVLVYLLSGKSLSTGWFPGFVPAQRRHLTGLGGIVLLAIAWSHWLSRYGLLYGRFGVTYGAGYTNANVQLPASTLLALIALSIGLWLLWRAYHWSDQEASSHRSLWQSLGVYASVMVLGSVVLPSMLQRLVVQPNELARERPYIEHNIAFTRQAFDLASIDAETFNPSGSLSYEDIQANASTIRNIRLWDTRPLLETNRQLQQIRLYYRFPDADIDRYNIIPENGTEPERQQVIIAARELDYSAVPDQAQTWINKHLVYTHGYGFTLSPVNRAGPGGLPDYFVKDIGVESPTSGEGTLATSSENIRDSIPIGQPRIYYGQLTNTTVMTPTKAPELDYPSGDENVYNVYDGRGGIRLNDGWRRLLFAKYLKNWQMVLTRNFQPETRVLFRRNIDDRIRAIAPFLRYDQDPYLVVADADLGLDAPGDRASAEDQNYLYWMVDAYTLSDRYPYSDPGDHHFNYIRNSVKAVIDAYHGSIVFYVADPNDPLIQTWQRIFPEFFRPLSEMPETLRTHIRYPIDLFEVQSERLLAYHMTDPQVFYNREDQWEVPSEIYGGEARSVEAYYLITKLPTASEEEFIVLHPFTPTGRNNLIAWLAGRSDGENYGRLLLYQFPKQRLVYGPQQIEARINQDPVISQQISLWNRQGSRAIQGNLLVIPIEQSLLYVEPLYLEAEENSLPILARVIVAYENRIAMAETLDQALRAIFQGGPTPASDAAPENGPLPTILREVEDPDSGLSPAAP